MFGRGRVGAGVAAVAALVLISAVCAWPGTPQNSVRRRGAHFCVGGPWVGRGWVR